MENLQNTLNEIAKFSDKTFGSGKADINRSIPILYHLKKEVDEAIKATELFLANPSTETIMKVNDEIADIHILALDYQRHFTPNADHLLTIINNKIEVNKMRKWGKPDCNGVIEHIKENKTC